MCYDVLDDGRGSPSYMSFVWPGFKAWALEWQKQGMIGPMNIDRPDIFTHPELEVKIKEFCESNDYKGLRDWWFEYLFNRQSPMTLLQP